MSDLKKMTVVVKNFNFRASGDIDALYSRVRLEDEEGKTFYFKEVVVPKYLSDKGALRTDTPITWYFKHLGKKSIIVVAFENKHGKVEYDLGDMRLIVRSTVIKGVLYSLGSIPGGFIAATATFGIGLVLIPWGVWYGYQNIFKVPAMLSRKRLLEDFSKHGIVVK
ncbi:hypothetical protein L6205_19485 [Pseudomonas syringae pv. syringae]|uniref:hypothetical protein n=1 Tax=Pseudomonas syringae TaxID=317 RepID=UPI001F0CF25B|nr:hypothetical protein [Pseudomonas syringae]MCH5531327.1 hypothetical protein [Pseudomonas syringae pv. syringae]MCH5541388.1 hypothetical protein [Pseudomonas syringae pv. syringae]MCH5546402.1 hypothetical protein [Pseudomonas syringae pv. syringae]MCH5604763.1 hypothetical protein [Pseudomonas syringae pv. syringae]MCH5609649.1 hypothetical protein [Pseudomonas syringae pv. syringae]